MVQDVLARVWEGRYRLAAAGFTAAYLYRSVVNGCRSVHRRRGAFPAGGSAEAVLSPEPGASEILVTDQVYRALPRLEALGLIQTVGEQRTSQGPVRSLYQATPAGQAAALEWLSTPAGHARDIRSELMVKLALLDRSGIDSRDLLQAQLARLRPVAEALGERRRASTGFEHTLVLWRHETVTATLRFLEALSAPDEIRAG